MLYLPWIISVVLTISLLYILWHNKAKRKPKQASQDILQEKPTIAVDIVEDIIRDFFSTQGIDFNYKIEDAESLSGAMFDSFVDLKKVIKSQHYINTLSKLKPILYDLESLAKVNWAEKETSKLVNNTIQLIEHTLSITRLNNISTDQLKSPALWENFDSSQIGKVEVRRSPWMYGKDIIVQGELQRKTDETQR